MLAEDDLLRCLWRKCRDAGPFASDKELYEHLDEAHTLYKADVGFKCRWDGCGKRYARPLSQGERARHLITHTEYRPYACKQRGCGAAFTRKDLLKKHFERHTEEEDDDDDDVSDDSAVTVARAPSEVACKFCSQTFSSSSARRAHINSAHDSDGQPRVAAGPAGGCDAPLAVAVNSTSAISCLEVEDWSDEDAFSTVPGPGHEELQEAAAPGRSEGLPVCDAERRLAAQKRIKELEALLRDRK